MKKKYFGILISLSLVAQPLMAAQLVSLSWKGAEESEVQWEDKVLVPGKKGRKTLSPLSQWVIQGNQSKIEEKINAVKGDQGKLYRLLYDLDGNDNPLDTYKMTPLHWAAAKDKLKIADMLIEATAGLAGMSDITPYVDVQDKFGRTPLMFATRKGQKNVAYLLIIRGANLDVQDELGRTALHWAAARAERPIAEALVNPQAAVDRMKSLNIKTGNTDNLSPATVRIQDNMGNTPLHYAVSVRYLLNKEKPVDDMLLALTATASSAALATFLAQIGASASIWAAAGTLPALPSATAAVQTAVMVHVTPFYSPASAPLVVPAAPVSAAAPAATGGASVTTATPATAAALTGPQAVVVIVVIVATTMFIQYGIPAIQKQDKKDKRDKIHADRGNIIAALLARDEATYGDITSKTLNELDTGIPALATRNNVGQLPSHVAAMAGNANPLGRLNDQANKDEANNRAIAEKFGYGQGADSLHANADIAGNIPLFYSVVRGDRAAHAPAGLGSSITSLARGLTDNKNQAQGIQLVAGQCRDGDAGLFFINPAHITPLKLALLFAQEVTQGSGKTVEDILNKVLDTEVYADASGQNILHYAARGGNKVVQIHDLYNNKEWYQFVPEIDDQSAHYEKRSGKSDQRMIIARDNAGATPIHYAAGKGTTVMSFSMGRQETSAKEMDDFLSYLEEGDRLDEMLDYNGMTPLHYAAAAGNLNVTESLMVFQKKVDGEAKKQKKQAKKDLASIKSYGRDAEGYAINQEGDRVLNKQGEPHKIPLEYANKTALDLASEGGHLKVFEYLRYQMKAKKEAKKSALEQAEKEKGSPLTKKEKKAVKKESKQEWKATRQSTKGAKKERKKDTKIAGRQTRTEKKIERRALKEAQAKRKQPRDPLILAAEEGREQSVKLLVRKGHASIAAGGSPASGENILFRHTYTGNDITQENKSYNNKTALRIAAEKGQRKMGVELLEAAQELDELALAQERTLYRASQKSVPSGKIGLSLAEIPDALKEEVEFIREEFLEEKEWSEDDIAEDEDKAAELQEFITPELEAYNDSIIVRSAVDELLYAPFDDKNKSAVASKADKGLKAFDSKIIKKMLEFDTWIKCLTDKMTEYAVALETGDVRKITSKLQEILDQCRKTAFDKKAQKKAEKKKVDTKDPLIKAAQKGKEADVKDLVQQRDRDLDVRDNKGRNALSYAAEAGRKKMVDVIIAAAKKRDAETGGGTLVSDMIGKKNDPLSAYSIAKKKKKQKIWEAMREALGADQ